MASVDIYSRRSPEPAASKPPRRRHHSSDRRFDEHSRKRRSRNSGFRRLLHLSRKDVNEKRIWIAAFVVVLLMVLGAAIWQFVVQPAKAKELERQKALVQPAAGSVPAAE